MIGRSNLSVGGGGSIVNGIIEQYLAESTTVDANTFVEFVNHYYNDTTLTDGNQYNFRYSKAVLIDTNKVFIAHTNDYYYLAGLICTISDNIITTGTDTTLFNYEIGENYSITKIDTNKVFIAHRSSVTNYKAYLNGVVCTISGTTITTGTDTTLVNAASSFYYISSVLIDTNKIFIAHSSDNTNKYLNGVVCTISETTITTGTDTTLVNAASSCYYASSVLIDTNKVFIAHSSDNTNEYLNGIICTISGTTITTGTDTTLVNAAGSCYYVSAVKLDTNKVFIAHRKGGAGEDTTNLRGTVCIVSGTTITTGTNTGLSGGAGYPSVIVLENNKVFIAHRDDNYYLAGLICSVNGTDITTVYKDPTIKVSETKIEGLTKTAGTTTTQAQVWVLDNE